MQVMILLKVVIVGMGKMEIWVEKVRSIWLGKVARNWSGFGWTRIILELILA